MKRGWKTFWIICAVIAAIGFGLCVAGIALGFNMDELDLAFKDDKNYIKENIVTVDEGMADSNTIAADTALTEDASNTSDLQSYEYVNDLSVDLGAGQLIIKTYNGDGVRCDFSGLENQSKYSVDQDGGKLDVDISWKKNRVFENGDAGSMIIYIPKDLVLEEFSLNAGAGEVIIGDINAKSISIDCGAGSVKYTTSQSEEDFNYDISCGIGEVTIGDSKFSGMGTDKKIDNHTAKDLDVDCGVGEIIITFI